MIIVHTVFKETVVCTWHSAACKSEVELVEYTLAQFSKPQPWQSRACPGEKG